jgi:hypothetical protein
MKKYILTIVVVLLVYMGCGWDTVDIPDDPLEPTFNPLHIRNMSTTSGITYIYGSRSDSGSHTYLDPSPQSGIPVDTVIQICDWYELAWWVERAIDSVVIDSGRVWIGREIWLLIEEDNGNWSCTWSNSGW